MILLLVSLLNHWIWEIYDKNLSIFLVTLFTTFLIHKHLQKPSIKTLIFSFAFFSLLSGLYVISTQTSSLLSLSPLEKDLQSRRLNSYPSNHLKLPYLLEQKSQTVAVYKLQNNLANIIDPNYYFFGSYPRQQQTPGEFIKFPFFHFPVLIYAIYKLNKKQLLFASSYALVCAAIIGLFGDKNHLGIFIMFPILTTVTAIGYQSLLNNYAKN